MMQHHSLCARSGLWRQKITPQRAGKKKTIMGYQKLHHLKGVCTRCCGVAGFRVSVGYIVRQLCSILGYLGTERKPIAWNMLCPGALIQTFDNDINVFFFISNPRLCDAVKPQSISEPWTAPANTKSPLPSLIPISGSLQQD